MPDRSKFVENLFSDPNKERTEEELKRQVEQNSIDICSSSTKLSDFDRAVQASISPKKKTDEVPQKVLECEYQLNVSAINKDDGHDGYGK